MGLQWWSWDNRFCWVIVSRIKKSERWGGPPLGEIVTFFAHKYSVIMPRHYLASWRHFIRETPCQDVGCFFVFVSTLPWLVLLVIYTGSFFGWVAMQRIGISSQFLQRPPQQRTESEKKFLGGGDMGTWDPTGNDIIPPGRYASYWNAFLFINTVTFKPSSHVIFRLRQTSRSRMASMATSDGVHTWRPRFQEQDRKDQRKMQTQTLRVNGPLRLASSAVWLK